MNEYLKIPCLAQMRQARNVGVDKPAPATGAQSALCFNPVDIHQLYGRTDNCIRGFDRQRLGV
jgi:hypothetical protein